MTPTLGGRFQTRLVLMLTIGVPLACCFGLAINNVTGALCLLGLSLGIGLLLDPFYDDYQHSRWDGDWPILLMVVTGVLEAILLWLLLRMIIVGRVQFFSSLFPVTNTAFLLMYGTIWLVMLLANLSLLPIVAPYRRFQGGKFWQ